MKKRTFLSSLPPVAALIVLFATATTPAPQAAAASGPGISVATLNMAKETSVDAVMADLRAASAVRDADIILLQEVAQPPGPESCAAETLAAALGRHIVWSPAATGVSDQGLAILSRWPLRDRSVLALKPFNLLYRSRSRIALSATADTPYGPVRISNAHLDTRVNARERMDQLEPVVRASASFRGPRIIGGDFNSNNFYWLAHVLPVPFVGAQASGVRDFMMREGFSSPLPAGQPTFDHLGMHLDWVWVNGLHSRTWGIYPMRFSDHHAVLVRVAW